MVDSGCFKTKLKKEKRRSDEGTYEDQTREKRRTDGEKNMDDIHRPYLIQRVLAAPNIGNPLFLL